jgi:hypothetical protein
MSWEIVRSRIVVGSIRSFSISVAILRSNFGRFAAPLRRGVASEKCWHGQAFSMRSMMAHPVLSPVDLRERVQTAWLSDSGNSEGLEATDPLATLRRWSSLLAVSKLDRKRSVKFWSWGWLMFNVPAWRQDACCTVFTVMSKTSFEWCSLSNGKIPRRLTLISTSPRQWSSYERCRPWRADRLRCRFSKPTSSLFRTWCTRGGKSESDERLRSPSVKALR